MCHSRELNGKINHLHERALRIVYEDKQSTFRGLLLKDNSVTIHERNLQNLAIEIFKVKLGVAPQIMNELFRFNSNSDYDLRSGDTLIRRNVHSVHYGMETISTLGPKIWNLLPSDIKNSISLSSFKSKIRNWTTDKCPCRLCKRYIQNLGFI